MNGEDIHDCRREQDKCERNKTIREERSSRRQDVVDEKDALPGLDSEAASELTVRRPVVVADLLREDRPHTELATGLEGEDDAAGRRAGNEIHLGGAVVGAVTAWQVAVACSAGRLLAPGWPPQ